MPVRPLDVDFSKFPVLYVTINAELTLEAINEHFTELEAGLQEHQGPFVMINEPLGKFISGEMRVKIGKRTDAFIEKYNDRYLGSAVVVKSVISRMMIQGAMLLIRSNNKIKLVGSREAAEEWAEKKLERRAMA
ncbi:MAG TPA: hypothetical protein DCE41_35810 [Cytophagales bacterium]|nr:hypothetical protein [Cytophagales bacterium]HAA24096.1 hypothetical protein [Cytophagales bacterium]HAP58316.1 hypothetical protein [Cytophagales bacterium]